MSSSFIATVAHDYIPVACGYSVNMNTALLLSQLDELVPVTDDPLALRMLELKYKRATALGLANGADDGTQGIRRSPDMLHKYNVLARTIATALLPPEKLAARTV